MWVVYGIDTRSRTLGSGEFYCPQCGEDRLYEHIRARRWFHIFGIGLIPLQTVGEHAECLVCHSTYEPSVVDDAPQLRSAAAASFEVALLQVVAMMIASDDGVDEDDAEAATALFGRLVGTAVSVDELMQRLQQAVDDPAFQEHFDEHVAMLGDPQREQLFAAGYRLATGAGPLDEQDVGDLEALGERLGLPRQTCARIVDEEIRSATNHARS
jgi:hypothetical protein